MCDVCFDCLTEETSQLICFMSENGNALKQTFFVFKLQVIFVLFLAAGGVGGKETLFY